MFGCVPHHVTYSFRRRSASRCIRLLRRHNVFDMPRLVKTSMMWIGDNWYIVRRVVLAYIDAIHWEILLCDLIAVKGPFLVWICLKVGHDDNLVTGNWKEKQYYKFRVCTNRRTTCKHSTLFTQTQRTLPLKLNHIWPVIQEVAAWRKQNCFTYCYVK